MKFRPLHDRILVERVAEEEKTKTGIYIPDAAREKGSRRSLSLRLDRDFVAGPKAMVKLGDNFAVDRDRAELKPVTDLLLL